MENNMTVSENILYAGVNDHEVDLFEGQYDVPLGMAYNSFVILDDKTAVTDTVSAGFEEEWLSNVEADLGGRKADYLIIHHMEPDHSSSISFFMEKYPEAVIVSSAKAFDMMQNFYGTAYEDRRLVIKDGDVLELGTHKLTFIAAPMVHWPEVHMSYESSEKVLFSADGFGKFGANDVEDPEGWACEARRYYFGIVGKFGPQVQKVLSKASALDIQTICPLHGPVLKDDLGYYLNIYNTWSSYQPEDKGVYIAYTSVYGHTKAAAEKLAEMLEKAGCEKVSIADLARDDVPEAVEDAFRYDTLVLATTTYNGGIFPFMKDFINELLERNYQNRRIAVIENGSWAAMPEKVIKKMFEASKNITFAENTVHIKSALRPENDAEMEALVKELIHA